MLKALTCPEGQSARASAPSLSGKVLVCHTIVSKTPLVHRFAGVLLDCALPVVAVVVGRVISHSMREHVQCEVFVVAAVVGSVLVCCRFGCCWFGWRRRGDPCGTNVQRQRQALMKAARHSKQCPPSVNSCRTPDRITGTFWAHRRCPMKKCHDQLHPCSTPPPKFFFERFRCTMDPQPQPKFSSNSDS